MVKPAALAKHAKNGNVRAVEEEWMKLVEKHGSDVKKLAAYAVVLEALAKHDNAELALTLINMTLEPVLAEHEPRVAIKVAGPYLRALGENQELRDKVTGLYRQAYEGSEGLEALIEEAGLPGGRPVRRALRTLDTCLNLNEGDYLVDRHEHDAAQVVEIDKSGWQFTIRTVDGEDDLGAVLLADQYHKTEADDFRVRRQFFKDELLKQFQHEPGEIVLSLAKLKGGEITRDDLEMEIVPTYMGPTDWKKWWTRARAALKKLPHVQIERKAPYTITCHDDAVAAEDIHLNELHRQSPLEQYDAIDAYLKECAVRSEETSDDVIKECYERVAQNAAREVKGSSPEAGLVSIIVRRVGELAGDDSASELALRLMKNAKNLEAIFNPIQNDVLHELACRTLQEARPDTWRDDLKKLLPTFPMLACEREAKTLVEAGCTKDDFEEVVEAIFARPIDCFEGLLWLWNGSEVDAVPQRPLVTILSRILRTLDDVRKADRIDKELIKRIGTRARAVLSARRYERYQACIESIESPMAVALKTQIKRLDNLGRAVREDLLKAIRNKFPKLEAKPETAPWLREDVLFVTRDGMKRKQEEIDQHVNVKMKENARAIGAAAEHGDLSENSEYKFALEERDLLRARLAQMNAEMAIAKIIDPEQVPVSHAGVGSRVVFHRIGDGERFEMTFVGPWESDPEAGMYNYKAPLAQSVLGGKVGDVIDFDHGRASGQYEIVALTNGLESVDEDEAQPAGNSTDEA